MDTIHIRCEGGWYCYMAVDTKNGFTIAKDRDSPQTRVSLFWAPANAEPCDVRRAIDVICDEFSSRATMLVQFFDALVEGTPQVELDEIIHVRELQLQPA